MKSTAVEKDVPSNSHELTGFRSHRAPPGLNIHSDLLLLATASN